LVAIEGLFTYNLGMLIVKGHRYYRYNCAWWVLVASNGRPGGGGGLWMCLLHIIQCLL